MIFVRRNAMAFDGCTWGHGGGSHLGRVDNGSKLGDAVHAQVRY